jgi:hypothetical protein
VATGAARCDLQGVEVEAMAPEHVLHALIEVFRRKKPRDGEDLQAKLQRRIGQAFIDSGLGRDAYLKKCSCANPVPWPRSKRHWPWWPNRTPRPKPCCGPLKAAVRRRWTPLPTCTA